MASDPVVDLGRVVPVVLCDRCGQPADAQRVDASTFSGPDWVWGRIVCTTPGCVDVTGSAQVDPPDEPGQLTREDCRWLRSQRFLADELAAVERRLLGEAW